MYTIDVYIDISIHNLTFIFRNKLYDYFTRNAGRTFAVILSFENWQSMYYARMQNSFFKATF